MVGFTPGGNSFERKIIMFSGGRCIPQLQKFTILAPSLGLALLTVNTCALLKGFSWLYFFLIWIIMGLKILHERTSNSVNDIGNSGNGVNAGTNNERQGRNEKTRSIAGIAGPVPNSTQQELYRTFSIPRDNGTVSEK